MLKPCDTVSYLNCVFGNLHWNRSSIKNIEDLKYLFSISFITILFFSCTSKSSEAQGTPVDESNNTQLGKVNLTYGDTNAKEWLPIKASLDSFYEIQVRAGFNGSVLVGFQGKVMYERYFGVADRDEKRKLSPETPSQLASTSKTFTGAAILYLHQQKFLNIDDEVSKYLAAFPYKGITIRMLLNHRSGVPDYLKWIPIHIKDTRTPISNDKVLQQMGLYKPALDFKPNTRFKYSNSNYVMLALIIEKASGMKYPEFMDKTIFKPLKMDNTFVMDLNNKPLDESATVSYKYNWVKEPMMFADGVYGDKGIYSTVQDLYKWDQSFYRNFLLSNDMMELAYGPCSFEKKGIRNYGLGWRMLCFPDGYKIIYHNGWWHGNNTCFYRFIKDNFTIVVLGNKYHNSIYGQPIKIYNLIQQQTGGEGMMEDGEE